jgi:hypothetical protein
MGLLMLPACTDRMRDEGAATLPGRCAMPSVAGRLHRFCGVDNAWPATPRAVCCGDRARSATQDVLDLVGGLGHRRHRLHQRDDAGDVRRRHRGAGHEVEGVVAHGGQDALCRMLAGRCAVGLVRRRGQRQELADGRAAGPGFTTGCGDVDACAVVGVERTTTALIVGGNRNHAHPDCCCRRRPPRSCPAR